MVGFRVRGACPICSGPPRTFYECGFGEEPLLGFLEWRYDQNGDLLTGGTYRLNQCTCCSLIYQDEVGDDQLLNVIYSEWIGGSAEGGTADPHYLRDTRWPFESRDAHEIMAAASFLRKPLSDLRTLDFGMGWALWANTARILGCESWGAEMAVQRVEYAKNLGISIAATDDPPAAYFDFINTEQVLEHLADPLPTAEKLVSALRPGGILKVSVPSAESLAKSRIEQYLSTRDLKGIVPVAPLEHVNGFTRASMAKLAQLLGVRIVRPSLPSRYSFVLKRRTADLRRPRQAIKEIVRPLVQYRMPSNLYAWLQKRP